MRFTATKLSGFACIVCIAASVGCLSGQGRPSEADSQRPGSAPQQKGRLPGAKGNASVEAEPPSATDSRLPTPPVRGAAGPSPGILSFSNFELGPEDLIGVTVLDAPEFSRQVRVSGDGKIRLPLIKMPIEAGGKTSSQLEQSIAQALVDDGLLVEPAVSVTMLEFNSKPVSISGAVRSPTVFQAIRPLTVGEAISRAGGLSESAGTDIVITIPARNENNAQTVHVPVKALQETDPKESKLLLRGGEEVTVSTAGQVYMLGGVAKPGAVLLNTEEPLTLLKALALSGGTTPGTGSKAFLLRAGAGGQKEEIMLNLNKLMKRQAPDLPLQTNDVVFIPDSKSRKLGQAGMNAAVSSFMYTIAGALILR